MADFTVVCNGFAVFQHIMLLLAGPGSYLCPPGDSTVCLFPGIFQTVMSSLVGQWAGQALLTKLYVVTQPTWSLLCSPLLFCVGHIPAHCDNLENPNEGTETANIACYRRNNMEKPFLALEVYVLLPAFLYHTFPADNNLSIKRLTRHLGDKCEF